MRCTRTARSSRLRPCPARAQKRAALAAAQAASGADEAALNAYTALHADTPLGQAARFNGANALLRQAIKVQAGAQPGQAIPLIELAKEYYRDVLRDDPTQWDARYNLERAQRLLPDPHLHGGGLHEAREGGRFQIHRDFDRHPRTGLCNEMVLLTYLNRQWDPAWQGALELWDAASSRCVKTIQPEFGRTLLLPNSPISFHGHEAPLTPPAGRTRRSLGSYYYSNRFPLAEQGHRPTIFLKHDHADRFQQVLKSLVPPVLWQAIKRASKR